MNKAIKEERFTELRALDNEKMIVYLETNKKSNVSLYNHYGFDRFVFFHTDFTIG